MTSFVNERTIEYSLIFELNRILSDHFKIYPFFYWKTREGTNVSKECFKSCKLRVIAIFARRTKVQSAYSPFVDIKTNQSLFLHSYELNKVGIKSIAGTCLGNSFESIGITSIKNWYSLDNFLDEDAFIRYEMESLETPYENQNNVNILKENEIIKLVKDSELFSWKEILEKIDIWRNSSGSGFFHRSFYGSVFGGYKPMFVLFEDNSEND